MKKAMLICALLLALCLMLTGCITINLERPSTSQATQAQPAVESTEYDAPSSEGSPLLYEEDADDEEEYEPDLPRTIEPAGEADQQGSVHVDYVIKDDLFATQMDEIGYYADEYIGKNFSLIGYVSLSEAGSRTQFAVLRDYKMPPHEHEDGEVVDHDDDEIYPVGIDCYFEGELPAEGAWVRVVGTLSDYDYVDEDGSTYPALMLGVQSIETISETEGGLRLVTQ